MISYQLDTVKPTVVVRETWSLLGKYDSQNKGNAIATVKEEEESFSRVIKRS